MKGVPYALLADVHAHAWSTYGETGPNGVNTRLQIIIDEMLRAGAELLAAGGHVMVVAGDLFHKRGTIDPEVFNPIHATIRTLLKMKVSVVLIPGNHDLKSRETTEIGNAFQSLGALMGCYVITKPERFVLSDHDAILIPWISDPAELLKAADHFWAHDRNLRGKSDLIIHAGIDGVLPRLEGHGLSPDVLADLGYRRVFAGHYHAHKSMLGGKVWSIGATTHQTWSDVGTKAGFLLVYPDRVEYRASNAPAFVEITGATDPDEIALIVEDNYVRVRDMEMDAARAKALREELVALGARGVSLQVPTTASVTRAAVTTAKAASLEESVQSYIRAGGDPKAVEIERRALDVLASVTSMSR